MAIVKTVVIKLDKSVKLITTCLEEKYVFQFINAWDLAVNSVGQEYVLLEIEVIEIIIPYKFSIKIL